MSFYINSCKGTEKKVTTFYFTNPSNTVKTTEKLSQELTMSHLSYEGKLNKPKDTQPCLLQLMTRWTHQLKAKINWQPTGFFYTKQRQTARQTQAWREKTSKIRFCFGHIFHLFQEANFVILKIKELKAKVIFWTLI